MAVMAVPVLLNDIMSDCTATVLDAPVALTEPPLPIVTTRFAPCALSRMEPLALLLVSGALIVILPVPVVDRFKAVTSDKLVVPATSMPPMPLVWIFRLAAVMAPRVVAVSSMTPPVTPAIRTLRPEVGEMVVLPVVLSTPPIDRLSPCKLADAAYTLLVAGMLVSLVATRETAPARVPDEPMLAPAPTARLGAVRVTLPVVAMPVKVTGVADESVTAPAVRVPVLTAVTAPLALAARVVKLLPALLIVMLPALAVAATLGTCTALPSAILPLPAVRASLSPVVIAPATVSAPPALSTVPPPAPAVSVPLALMAPPALQRCVVAAAVTLLLSVISPAGAVRVRVFR